MFTYQNINAVNVNETDDMKTGGEDGEKEKQTTVQCFSSHPIKKPNIQQQLTAVIS